MTCSLCDKESNHRCTRCGDNVCDSHVRQVKPLFSQEDKTLCETCDNQRQNIGTLVVTFVCMLTLLTVTAYFAYKVFAPLFS